jgi:hypothetical protein
MLSLRNTTFECRSVEEFGRLIQDRRVKRTLVVLTLSLLTACVHREDVHPTMVYDDSPPPPPPEREVIVTEQPAQVAAEPPPTRPRLSRTVTLGEGTDSQYQYAGEAARPPQGAAQGSNVVINNNVVVNGGAPAGYGYGGYGYGGYVQRGGYGRPTTSSWGTTGWEGARRTAAPGQTPGVGGNWAPPPSYGPAQMK